MYNFLIGDDGSIYEGRGWKYRSASRLRTDYGYEADGDDGSLSIALIGTFRTEQESPSPTQIHNTLYLMEQGVLGGKLWPNHTIIVERNLYCPLRNVTQFAAAKVVQATTASKSVLKSISGAIC